MILKKGQMITPALYYIFKGKVEVTIEQGNKISSDFTNLQQQQSFFQLNEKSTFGQQEFFSQSHESSLNVKSLNVTTVHILHLSDFQETIKHYVNDKEIYQELKDKLNDYQDYLGSGIFCYSCKSNHHVINDCPLFFYRPNKQRVVNLYLKVYEQAKNQIERSRERFTLNALAFQYEIEEECKYFREVNFNEDFSEIINSVNQSKGSLQDLQGKYINSQNLIYNTQKSDSGKNLKVTFEVDQRDKSYETHLEKQRDQSRDKHEQEFSILQINQDNLYHNNNNLEPKIIIESFQNSQQFIQNQQPNESFNLNLQPHTQQQFQQTQQQQYLLQVKSQREEFIKRISLRNTRCKNNLAQEKKTDDKQTDNKKQSVINQIDGLQINKNSKNSLTIDMMKKVLDQMQKINSRKVIKLHEGETDEFIAESVKCFKFYMTHSNVAQVIQSYNKYYSLKTRRRRKISYF